MIRTFFQLPACVLLSIILVVGSVQAQAVPQCLADFCLDKELPTEKEVHKRLGGFRQPAVWEAFAYCYRFIVPKQKNSYGYFIFKNFGFGWELITMHLSQEVICPHPQDVKIGTPLLTEKGIGLGFKETELLKAYGQPRYKLRPPPTAVIQDFFNKNLKTGSYIVDQYASDYEQDPLNALFFISNDRIVGIEISADE